MASIPSRASCTFSCDIAQHPPTTPSAERASQSGVPNNVITALDHRGAVGAELMPSVFAPCVRTCTQRPELAVQYPE
jgi:hypothetical protein